MIRHPSKILTTSLWFIMGGFYLSFIPSSLQAAPTFDHEVGTRLSNSLPQTVISTGSLMRMFFIRDFVVRSATSTDGLTWTIESGIRLGTTVDISSIASCSLVQGSTVYRMILEVGDSNGNFRFLSASSSNTINWAVEGGTRMEVQSGTTYIGSPEILKISDNDWRLFYVQDTNGGNDLSDRQIFSSQSSDEGSTWSTGVASLSGERADNVSISTLPSGRARLFYSAPLTGGTTSSQILSARSTSSQLVTFTKESNARVSTDVAQGSLSSPFVLRSSDTFRWRMYHSFTAINSTIPVTVSALTFDPEVKSISPTSVLRTEAPTTFTIQGEIFSSTPTVMITKSGETSISATSVSRTDDQTLTAVIDPLNKGLGRWNVVVINADGRSGALTNGLEITFASGEISFIDNLLRPRSGLSTQIIVNIFEAGRVILKIYTMDGKLVKTVLDENEQMGTFTALWDGKTDDGNTVASGTYILKSEGPKLGLIKKIVVIK